jgi:hypothetical protein
VSFDSEVRIRGYRNGVRASESGHQPINRLLRLRGLEAEHSGVFGGAEALLIDVGGELGG